MDVCLINGPERWSGFLSANSGADWVYDLIFPLEGNDSPEILLLEFFCISIFMCQFMEKTRDRIFGVLIF